MTRLTLFGATALLGAIIAIPATTSATAQTVIQEPGVYARSHPWANDYDYNYGYRRSGFWPGDVAAGVVGAAVGTAGAIATAPFRNGYAYDRYAYYNEPAYDDSYYVERRVSRRPACGIQPGATYMGPDGRWYPC